MATYQFAILDPRAIPAATTHNDAILGANTLGIEVTIAVLAERCGLGNIDPQHTQGLDMAAAEVALTMELPPEGATLVTLRADPDSFAAMAILYLRARGHGHRFGPKRMNRIRMIAESDKFNRGSWAPKPLPTMENRWPESPLVNELAAIAAAVVDHKVTPEARVKIMARWILSGYEPMQYRMKVEAERDEMIRALENGDIQIRTVADGKMAVVISPHRAATSAGYTKAPVVIAANYQFTFNGGQPHLKYTVVQFEPGYVDLRAAGAELAALEPGWGGNPTLGSPQGVASQLTIEQVVEIIQKHLL